MILPQYCMSSLDREVKKRSKVSKSAQLLCEVNITGAILSKVVYLLCVWLPKTKFHTIRNLTCKYF